MLGHLSDDNSSSFVTSPVRQQTEAGDKRGDQMAENKSTLEPNRIFFCLLTSNILSLLKSEGTGDLAIYIVPFPLLLQGKATQTRQKQTNLPGRSLGLPHSQLTNHNGAYRPGIRPSRPITCPGLPRQRIVNFIKYVKGGKISFEK